MSVSSKEIGEFVDGIADKKRTPKAVTGRLIEEVVELGLSVGMTPGEIFEHVADSLANQAMKVSLKKGHTVFPSEIESTYIAGDVSEECADVSLVLKDLCHVTQTDLGAEEDAKFSRFKTLNFQVSPAGTLYGKKAHIVGRSK